MLFPAAVVQRFVHHNDGVRKEILQKGSSEPLLNILVVHFMVVIAGVLLRLKYQSSTINPSILCAHVQDNQLFAFARGLSGLESS